MDKFHCREVEVKGATKPYHYISATAVGNRAFLLSVNASGRQWRVGGHERLQKIQQSFFVSRHISADTSLALSRAVISHAGFQQEDDHDCLMADLDCAGPAEEGVKHGSWLLRHGI